MKRRVPGLELQPGEDGAIKVRSAAALLLVHAAAPGLSGHVVSRASS